MEIRKVRAGRLNPAAYNPRRDLKPGDRDYEKLKRSIEEFGFVEPVVWNERTGFVVGGHQRLKVLLDMGKTEIDCVVVDLEPDREKALNLALNRIQGDWDEGKLAEVLADLDASAFDVSFTGFDAEEIDALMNKFYSAEAAEDDFDCEQAEADIEAAGGCITEPGDIWQLGGHRLLCGDGADSGDMERLMGMERAACTVTAPPVVSMAEYKKDGLVPWLSRMGRRFKISAGMRILSAGMWMICLLPVRSIWSLPDFIALSCLRIVISARSGFGCGKSRG